MLSCHWILNTFRFGLWAPRYCVRLPRKNTSTYQLRTDKTAICVGAGACVCVQIECKLTTPLRLCLPTSRLLTAGAAERRRDKQTPAATCICTAFLVFNSPQLTVSIVTGWEELKTEKDIQDIGALPPPAAGSASCSATVSHWGQSDRGQKTHALHPTCKSKTMWENIHFNLISLQ